VDRLVTQLGPPTFVSLPQSGANVEIPTARVQFAQWNGDPAVAPRYNRNAKPAVDLDGTPMFPELVILRDLERDGWEGLWVDSYSRRFVRVWPPPPTPPSPPLAQQSLLARIKGSAGFPSGCWDIFAWQEDRVLFVESKRRRKDQVRDSQRRWLEAALEQGVTLSSFLFVEWDWTPSAAG
jgi:hypothetical protein